MKLALVIAASFALTTTATFAGDNCSSKSSCSSKKVSLAQKLFGKKIAKSEKTSDDTDLQFAGTNLIIN
jgi:hypothetical protein